MNTNDKKLQEQKAPEKNTDHAFVQVGSDGHPVIPKKDAGAETSGQPGKKNAPNRPNK